MGWLANSKARKGLVSLSALAAVATAVFVGNEARKEIFYLCGNFAPGVNEASVREQLDTGDFLQYRASQTPTGSRITVDSWYNLRISTCTIEIDADGYVMSATYDQAS